VPLADTQGTEIRSSLAQRLWHPVNERGSPRATGPDPPGPPRAPGRPRQVGSEAAEARQVIGELQVGSSLVGSP